MSVSPLLLADWPAPPGVRALTTLRHGLGMSQPPFDDFNLGNRYAGDGDDPIARRRFTSALKIRANQAARLAAEDSVQLHGAIGMTEEYILGRYVRFLAAAQTLFGDADWHLERLAAQVPSPQ